VGAGRDGGGSQREDWGKPIRDPNVPEFLALNPNGQVPVIVEDGFVLWESHAVLRYLAKKHGANLWPFETQKRAIVDQWMSWQSSDLNPAWSYVGRARLRAEPPNPDPARIEESIRAWTKQMRVLEGQLARGNGFVANDAFSLADIVIGLSTHRWMSIDFDKPALPAVARHYAQMQSRPAAVAYLGATTP